MAHVIAIRIPHSLGKDKALRRIREGFGELRQKLSNRALGLVSFQDHWEGDQLHFAGNSLGQRVGGRVGVLADSVHVELDLPQFLAPIAERIAGKLRKEGQLLLQGGLGEQKA